MKNKKRSFLVLILIIFTMSVILYKLGINNKYKVENFCNTFMGIIIEATPFILLGSIVSAVMQIYVSNEAISRIIPKNSVIGYFGAALIGIIFPVCECAIIPITRTLIKKGVPLGFAITFMLAVPIINPVVIMSTYTAFYDKPAMMILRIVGGIVGSISIGMIMSLVQGKRDYLLLDRLIENKSYCNCGCNDNSCFKKDSNRFKLVLEHAIKEFFDIIRYLLVGTFIATGFQVIISTDKFNTIGNGKILSIVFMMFLAFILSICSEADAFIGKSLLNQYSFSSVAIFLIMGPMLDIKNLIILGGIFKKSFVIKLVITVVGVVGTLGYIFVAAGL
ncbi:permease [Clostridium uliginosum]|uniref:Permease n=1 Tax=Clostridium uliginosum TaxID=119641 RepID=A0A1I1S4F0_9CLOT|nr:permease [Clostridium uliginosum]SFD41415.1 hypothetical protein SAMN05421842_1444 [Clostridium uliginosum]